MFSTAVVCFALAASALANVFITSPVSDTNWPAGQQAVVTWIDSGDGASLQQFGIATFGVYAGNKNQQTLLQIISASVNVSTISSLAFTPDGSIGPNSNEYFIRATSTTLKDPSAPQYPLEVFSAKFTLSGMSGTFNSTIQQEINGQSTAPIGGASTTGSPSATGATAVVTGSSSATASGANPTSTNSAGKPVVATSFIALAAALVGASLM